MKKIGIIVGLLLLSLGAFAQDKLHNLQIAYEVSNYKYREPGLMYLRAQPKQGISILYTRRSVLSGDVSESDRSFASLEFRYMTGKVDYHGGRFDGTPLTLYNLKDYYFEGVLRVGAAYDLNENWELWPYLGFGWRQLRNHLEEGGPGGYLRESTYWYLPIGLNTRFHTESGWNFVLNGEFDWLLKGTQYSGEMDLGEPIGTLDGNTNAQNQGYGVRISLKAEKSLGKIGLFVEPFWRYWHIQNSSIGGKDLINYPGWYLDGFYEPKNYTHEYGLKAGITF